LEIVRYLLQTKHARVDIDVEGFYPIHFACLVGITEIVELLTSHSPAEISRLNSMGYSPLHIAVANDHLQTVLLLLKLGANVGAAGSQNRNTPLHVGMRSDDIRIAECLIAVDGALLTTRNFQNEVPLDIAVRYGNEIMTRFLRRVMNFEVPVPLFEVVYMRCIEGMTVEQRERANREVIEMLCKKVQGILFEPVPGE
jgi:ankyrin repeat protein